MHELVKYFLYGSSFYFIVYVLSNFPAMWVSLICQ